ncbi:FecR family protein [Mucilaginibacter mallensis]|uniref:FecR family protein n=1 Tax=Mucilaginibacter mallensis TaxID=652787 RepID=A0A1H1ZNH8_MUCMA|nr:FecR domain-containing protein [Mucilaginibacter mallensis]SDT35278.1 FecR family protein [Mucilaginibacter mallensis]
MDEKEFQQKLIQRYLNNQCTDEELEAFFHLIEKGLITDALIQEMDVLLNTDEDTSHQDVQLYPDAEKRKLNLRRLLGYAAMLLLCFSTCFYFVQHRIHPINTAELVKYDTVETQRGEIKRIELADKSVLFLNAHSRLRYPEKFSNKLREVDLLEGEVYCAIYHDKNKPFIVRSGNINTQVLGTAFNISFYKYLKSVSISVTQGKVSVTAPGQNSKLNKSILLPGDKISINKLSGKTTYSKIAMADDAMGWTSGKLIFDNKSLGEVANVLSDRFNTEIGFADNSIMHYHITATFNSTDHLLDIIKMLCISNKLRYHVTDKKIVLMFN